MLAVPFNCMPAMISPMAALSSAAGSIVHVDDCVDSDAANFCVYACFCLLKMSASMTVTKILSAAIAFTSSMDVVVLVRSLAS